MKKFLAIMLISVSLFSLCSVNSFAWESIDTFEYWYSSGNDIGYIPSNGNRLISIVNNSACEITESQLSSYLSYARNAWTSEGTFSQTTSSSSDCTMLFADINRNLATIMGISSNAVGVTLQDKTLVGYATYGSSRKNVYTFNEQMIYLIYDDISSSYSSAKWKSITAHEFGHAVGYLGHDTSATSANPSLMNPTIDTVWDDWRISTPQTRDLRHMSNI